MSEFAKDLLEMINGWNLIEKRAREQFPNATDEEIYQITNSTFRYSLGLS